MRALEESAAVAKLLVDSATRSLKERFAEKERAMTNHARTIKQMLLSSERPSPSEVVGSGSERGGSVPPTSAEQRVDDRPCQRTCRHEVAPTMIVMPT